MSAPSRFWPHELATFGPTNRTTRHHRNGQKIVVICRCLREIRVRTRQRVKHCSCLAQSVEGPRSDSKHGVLCNSLLINWDVSNQKAMHVWRVTQRKQRTIERCKNFRSRWRRSNENQTLSGRQRECTETQPHHSESTIVPGICVVKSWNLKWPTILSLWPEIM